jgi:hypothetical protein
MSEETKELYSPQNTWGKGYKAPPRPRRPSRRNSPRLKSLTESKVPVGALVDGFGRLLRENPGRAQELREALAESRGKP